MSLMMLHILSGRSWSANEFVGQRAQGCKLILKIAFFSSSILV